MGIFGTIVLGYLVGSMLTFGPIMFILGAFITVTFIAGYIEADNTTYLIIYSLSTAFAVWGFRIKEIRKSPTQVRWVFEKVFKYLEKKRYSVSLEKMLNRLGEQHNLKDGSLPYVVDASSIRINEHGFYPSKTREDAKEIIINEIEPPFIAWFLSFVIGLLVAALYMIPINQYYSEELGYYLDNYKILTKLILVAPSMLVVYVSASKIKRATTTEDDISFNYRKYKEKVMEIAREAYQKEAEQKQKEMIAAREKERKAKAEKDKKAKEAELKRQRKVEKEKQEEEEFEAKLADLHSDIMKSSRSK